MEDKAIDSIKTLKDSLDDVGSSVDILLNKNYESVEEQLSNLESTKLNVALAYSIASLYYSMLKSKGSSIANHPIKSDLSRIKSYVDRINTIEKGVQQRKATVNVSAAGRLLKHELKSNVAFDDMQSQKRKKFA
mmetsp:Transcript_19933/g.20046  ORF Transcript_19933/g.20046 Transcript_19933/m.20046 type:complete len:134 (+) Transcript_19933:103-504(+)